MANKIPSELQIKSIIKRHLDSEAKRVRRFSVGVPSDDPVLGGDKGSGLKSEEAPRFLSLPRKFPMPREIPRVPMSFDSGPSDPSSAEDYAFFFNTSQSKLKIWFSSAWHVFLVLDTSGNAAIVGRYLKE